MNSFRKGKFNAKPTFVGTNRFASKREAARFCDLLLLEKAGAIKNLELQPRYPLEVNGHKVCTYVADFKYWDVSKGCMIVEDCKGMRTREYILKRNLFRAVTGREILET